MTVLRQFARSEATDTGPVPLGTGAMKVKGEILNQVQNDEGWGMLGVLRRFMFAGSRTGGLCPAESPQW